MPKTQNFKKTLPKNPCKMKSTRYQDPDFALDRVFDKISKANVSKPISKTKSRRQKQLIGKLPAGTSTKVVFTPRESKKKVSDSPDFSKSKSKHRLTTRNLSEDDLVVLNKNLVHDSKIKQKKNQLRGLDIAESVTEVIQPSTPNPMRGFNFSFRESKEAESFAGQREFSKELEAELD